MAILDQSVCTSWASIADVCEPCNRYDLDTALLEDMLLVSSELLFGLTGSRYPGVCTDTVRPCAEYGAGRRLGPADMPWWSGQQITATGAAAGPWGVCGCNRDVSCGCNSLSVIRLPRRPVIAIQAVWLNGALLDPTFYRLDDHHKLTYLPGTDGVTGWPCCQDLTLDLDEDGTLGVTYAYGTDPPASGVAATASLACQLTLARVAPSACKLPQRLTSITRQGVTMTIVDQMNAIREGWTGLPDVDLFIASERAKLASRRGVVINPEAYAAFRRTGQ